MSLQGKRCLVTGGSRGLGRAICRALLARGARVAFTHTREADTHDEGRPFRVSVLDSAGTDAMVQQLEKEWGGVDVLINNAGISQALPLALLEEADWDRVMDVNVKGTYLTSRAVARGMMRRKSGVILNIGSLAGERMLEAPIHYCASKAAVSGMTRAMAKELSRHNVRVLCLAPGLLDDGVGKNVPEHRLADYLSHVSLERLGTIDEIAELATFLVSDECSYINGETIVADGGL
jgi:3-oxoacyl-[acyl-carrier protein] reductase